MMDYHTTQPFGIEYRNQKIVNYIINGFAEFCMMESFDFYDNDKDGNIYIKDGVKYRVEDLYNIFLKKMKPLESF
jgi:hypothetical protein